MSEGIVRIALPKFGDVLRETRERKEVWAWDGIIPAKDVTHYVGRTIRVAGWLVTTRRVTTVNNEQMRFLTLEDLTDVVEIVFFPKTYRKYGALIQSFGPYLVRGKVEDDNTHSTLTANHLELL